MRLSVYLIREPAPQPSDLIAKKYRSGLEKVKELPVRSALPYEVTAYYRTSPSKPPKWLKTLDKAFELPELVNLNHGVLLLLKASGRTFAVSFGQGYLFLDRGHLETNFGLRVCANSLDPSKLRTLDARTVDVVTRQQRTHLSSASPVYDFNIEVNEEWVRFLSGFPLDRAFAKSLAGADSLTLNAELTLEQLSDKCTELLGRFNSQQYKESFPFLDTFAALRRTDPRVAILEASLLAAVKNRKTDLLCVAFPEIPDEERLESVRIYVGYNGVDVPELSLPAIYSFLAENQSIANPLDEVKLVGLDGDGQPCTKAHSFREYVVAELSLEGKPFAASAGSWFLIEPEFASSVRSKLEALPDLTDTMDLAPMRAGETEARYNERLASVKGWILMDKRCVQLSERNQRVEVCDLLTLQGQFICVKKMSKSSTLSHLFAQGAVSADLLKGDDNYRTWTESVFRKASQSGSGLPEQLQFVFAVATDKVAPLSKSLFLFSAIQLLRQSRFIQRLGYGVGLARIPLPEGERIVRTRRAGRKPGPNSRT